MPPWGSGPAGAGTARACAESQHVSVLAPEIQLVNCFQTGAGSPSRAGNAICPAEPRIDVGGPRAQSRPHRAAPPAWRARASACPEPRRRLGDIELFALGLVHSGCKLRIRRLRRGPPIPAGHTVAWRGAFCSKTPPHVPPHRFHQCRWGRGGAPRARTAMALESSKPCGHDASAPGFRGSVGSAHRSVSARALHHHPD